MMNRLPQFIDPLQLAEKQGFVNAQISLIGMLRLKDRLFKESGEVDISLSFSKDGKLAKIEGIIKSIVPLVCQNCLGLVEWPIDSKVKLGIVSSMEEANLLPEDYEPLLVEDNVQIGLKDMIEDELLLILPNFPKHQHNCLVGYQHINNGGILESERVPDKNKPFSILASLKKSGEL